jgi:uncharacterized protein (UPF0276 family)
VAGDDRFGLGWRPELAAGLIAHLDDVDVLEVLADDHLDLDRRDVAALRRLASERPVLLHGTGLGLVSASAVDERRLERLARLVEAVRAEAWSEHLAFVRSGGVEIGHLAAPPRTPEVVEGTARNAFRARAVVGSLPHLENVATLVEPPGGLCETAFVTAAIEASGAGLLLDLHNLHANATNFGFDAVEALDRLPLDRVSLVHVAGGRTVRTHSGTPRILDDHLHPLGAPVLDLLVALGRRAPRPLTVVLERDGLYPRIDVLLAELAAARDALRRGRALAA